MQRNDFFLHSLIRQVKSFNELKERLADISEAELTVAAQTRAPDRSLPIEVAKAVKIPAEEKRAIYNFLLPFTLKSDCPKFNKPVCASEVMQQLNCAPHSSQAELIAIACEVVNTVKHDMEFSPSHPDGNFLAADFIQEKNNLLVKARKETDAQRNELIFDAQNIVEQVSCDSYSVYLSSANFSNMLQLEVARSLSLKVGNCDELSNYALLLMRQKYPHIRCGVFQIMNGDHVFLAINLPVTNDLEHPAVLICDIWSGQIFPGDQIRSKLKDLVDVNGYDRKYSVLVNFDPTYQCIKPVYLNQRFFIYDQYFQKRCPTLRVLQYLSTRDQLYFLFFLRGTIRHLLCGKQITLNQLIPFMSRLSFLRQLLSVETIRLLEEKKICLTQLASLTDEQALQLLSRHRSAKKRRLTVPHPEMNLFGSQRRAVSFSVPQETEPKLRRQKTAL